jgi:hypothetical protein
MTRVRDQMELTLPVRKTKGLLLALGNRQVCEAREICRIEMTVWKKPCSISENLALLVAYIESAVLAPMMI